VAGSIGSGGATDQTRQRWGLRGQQAAERTLKSANESSPRGAGQASPNPCDQQPKQPTSARGGAPFWMKMTGAGRTTPIPQTYFHGRDSWLGQRKHRALCIEFVQGVVDRPQFR